MRLEKVPRSGVTLIRATVVYVLALTAALAAAATPFRCLGEEGGQLPTKATQEVSHELRSLFQQKNMSKNSPILVRLFKEEAELEVWKQDTTGHFQILKVYPICRWSGDLGPKLHEGDRQAPEGFYTITPELMNSNSNYYLAINIGFPNSFDKANDRDGTFLMIHGDCWSSGCYAMTDEQIGEIYSLVRELIRRRPAVIPDPGLSVPFNAGQPGAASNQSEYGLLEDAQDRQRSFRGDASRTQSRCVRSQLCVRCVPAAEFVEISCVRSDR